MRPALNTHLRQTPEQARAQEVTVRILRRHCDEAESYLRERAERGDAVGAQARLCPCGIDLEGCLCPLRRK
ncbi:MAG: hypothetical protein IAE86_06970 [Burkholderiaceae bacterium]|nr:hypothetical protein [Burkholderiaceae bacterium]